MAMGQASSAIAAAISAVDTAFVSQQGSAFVSAPANPPPDSPGGGVWARAVGGHNDLQSVSSNTLTQTNSTTGVTENTTNVTCSNAMKLDFAGVQVGADIAKLNWNGWNIHFGSSAGYLGSKTNETNSVFNSASIVSSAFASTFQVPFVSTYLVATKGRFFADLNFREQVFNINLSDPTLALGGQPMSAHGFAVSTSAGYNFDAGNNWFIEPSAGFSYSRTSVDGFTLPGSVATAGIMSTININNIESELGRVSLRFGKAIETPTVVWQPFASASVLREFAGNTTATAVAPGQINAGSGACSPSCPTDLFATNSTSRVGTYEQYSVGVSASVINTGWLGYVRADFRDGPQLTGWGLSGGIRYQFTPVVAAAMPTKVKAPVAVIMPTNWTGLYVGGVIGAQYGRTDISLDTDPTMYARPYVAGLLGGAEAGYNYQVNRIVLGIEGDINATNTKGARTLSPSTPASIAFLPPTPNTSQPNNLVGSDRTTWVATVTGRLGYAVDRTLYYVKAGGAFENSKVAVTCYDPQAFGVCANPAFLPLDPGGSISKSYTRVGFTAGFGTEFDLGRGWSAKTEIDYLDFGRKSALSSDFDTTISDWSHVWQGKIGLNYHFNPGPVVARY